ncbi:MAG TPA: DUF6398 domain-containing protein, partial [Pseudonocardia sp.]|nr:DUF6398 domain-containing protein [Pseudonocardia sp.]
SPVAVEILLVDWVPRKIVADVPYLAEVPGVLRAFIRFAHDERGIRPELTAEALAAVDEYEPEYQEIVRTPRPQGPAALLAALGVADPSDLGEDLGEDLLLAPVRALLADIARTVGGADTLDRLDTAPLPDEAFVWEPIAPDVRDRVGEVLGLVERCCDELLDVEYRTACRRFLARSAAADPGIFRRRGRVETAAAAVCWVIGRVNDLFLPSSTPHVMAKDLHGYFGVTSSSQRAGAFVAAVGGEWDAAYGGVYLGSPDYLVSSCRAELVALRDRHRDRLR